MHKYVYRHGVKKPGKIFAPGSSFLGVPEGTLGLVREIDLPSNELALQ